MLVCRGKGNFNTCSVFWFRQQATIMRDKDTDNFIGLEAFHQFDFRCSQETKKN